MIYLICIQLVDHFVSPIAPDKITDMTTLLIFVHLSKVDDWLYTDPFD